jgi:hypothetical protein
VLGVALSALSGLILGQLAGSAAGWTYVALLIMNAIGWGLLISIGARRSAISEDIPESVAEVRKMYATCSITATVLKNGEFAGERKINQPFDGSTGVYTLPARIDTVNLQKPPRDLVELVLTTHVVAWQRVGTTPPGFPQPPFVGGTREGS